MFFVSAGHHPATPGACFHSFCEYDEADRWADIVVREYRKIRKLKEWLPEAMRVPGFSLREKVAFINARAPLLAVEIHFNSARNNEGEPVGKGCETLYYPGSTRGKACAEIMQAAVAPTFPPSRGVKEGWYRLNPDNGPDFFLDRTRCAALILEPDFIHRRARIQARREEGAGFIAVALAQCFTQVLDAGV